MNLLIGASAIAIPGPAGSGMRANVRYDRSKAWHRKDRVRTIVKLVAVMAVFSFLSTLPYSPPERQSIARAEASGTTFGSAVIINDVRTNEQTNPALVSLPGGELFAVWQDTRAGYGAIYSSRSFDNGTTWSPNKRVDDPPFSTSSYFARNPAVTVTTNGTIFIVWEDNRRSTFDYDIFSARSFDRGASFTKNVRVDDGSAGSWAQKASVAITLKGTVYVAWTDDRTGILRARGSYSNDLGSTFSASSEIAPSSRGGETEVALSASSNTIYAAFMDNVTRATPHPFFCKSANGGQTFNNPFRLDNTGRRGRAQYGLSMSAVQIGGFAAVWADTRNGNSDIYMTVVAPDGSFSLSNLRIEDDSSYAYAWQENPCVVTDALGNIYAAWQDERTTGYPAIRLAVLKVGKSAFDPSVEVAHPSSGALQMMPSVAAPNPGHPIVSWQDDRGVADDDVYATAGNVPNVYRLALTPGWNLISTFVDGVGYKASTLGLLRGDLVVGWNSTTGMFDKKYIVGISPPSADFTISSSTGYWIFATVTETLNLNGTATLAKQSKKISVASGGDWVAIGFDSFNSSRRASDIPSLFSVTGGITMVVSYDTLSAAYSVYLVGLPSTDFKIVSGRGYWVWCKVSGTLSYSP